MMKSRYKSERIDSSGAPLRLVTDEDDDGALPQPKFLLKTLSEQGPNLPVGVGEPRSRLFRVRPFKMKQEKALAKMRDEAKGSNIGNFVCEALSMMVQTIGPHNFDDMKDGKRQLVINQLSMPDVLYLYMYLRFDALGDEPVVMQIRCPSCTHEYRWYGDLGSMEVRVVADDTSPLVRNYELRDSFEIRGKEAKTLQLGLIRWDSFSKPEFQNKNALQNSTISASIVGIKGFDAVPGTWQTAANDLDDMTKFDMGGLIADIEQNTPGPQLDVEPKCPSCEYSQKMMLDWSWDNFFSRSVRPSPTKT